MRHTRMFGGTTRSAKRPPGLLMLCALAAATALAGCATTAHEYLQQAKEATALSEKERLLSLALEKDPRLNDARLQRAWVYVLQEKFPEAFGDYDFLRRTTRSLPHRAQVFFWRGRALDRNKQFAEAAASYSEALRIDPRFLNPYAARAQVFFKMGKYASSMQDYLVMLDRDINPTGLDAAKRRSSWRFWRGVAGFCAGEWESAASDFRDAIRGSQSPGRKARTILYLYFVACRIASKQKADEVLARYAKDSLARYGADKRDTPWIFSAVWYVAGLINEEQFLLASQHTKPRTQARRTAGAYYYIGARHLANGATDQALEAFKKCVEHKDPELAEYHMAKVEMARLLVGGKTANDYASEARKAKTQQEKIKLYTEALRVNPNHTDARLNRALLYSLTGKHALAIDDYTHLLKLYSKPSNRAVALRYRAWTRAQSGDHLAAVKDYEAAVKADPELWQAREGLAVSLCYLRRYREAAAVYEALTKLIVGTGMKTFWRGEHAFALCCAGDWLSAAQDFRGILRKAPDSPIIRTNLFIVETKLGNKSRAAKELRDYAAKIKIATWQSAVAWYTANMLDVPKFLRASNHSDRDKQLLRTSRAYYYIGAAHLLKGGKHSQDQARQAFEKCVRLGRQAKRESWEFRMALAELARKKQWR